MRDLDGVDGQVNTIALTKVETEFGTRVSVPEKVTETKRRNEYRKRQWNRALELARPRFVDSRTFNVGTPDEIELMWIVPVQRNPDDLDADEL
jgi:hypothetical protein